MPASLVVLIGLSLCARAGVSQKVVSSLASRFRASPALKPHKDKHAPHVGRPVRDGPGVLP
eukprot:15034132-Alexandrium_andersonii.AAC.1